MKSTTVEIILYYLTVGGLVGLLLIYNSRNYSILLNGLTGEILTKSTTVEIILYYLTFLIFLSREKSTTVEIILYYLTVL